MSLLHSAELLAVAGPCDGPACFYLDIEYQNDTLGLGNNMPNV